MNMNHPTPSQHDDATHSKAPTARGRISQVTGAVVDVEFADGCLPGIFTALRGQTIP